MEAVKTPSNYKSPKHKLVRFFERHRDRWRERAHKYRKQMRALSITVRDLRKSREDWKEKFLREREARLRLEAQLEHPPPRGNRSARLTSATAGQRTR